jgi:hypothetical protein
MLSRDPPEVKVSIRTGPNFVGLWDHEQDPVKLFKKHHVDDPGRGTVSLRPSLLVTKR